MIIEIDNDGSPVYLATFQIGKGEEYAMSVEFNRTRAMEMSHLRAIVISAFLQTKAGFKTTIVPKGLPLVTE